MNIRAHRNMLLLSIEAPGWQKCLNLWCHMKNHIFQCFTTWSSFSDQGFQIGNLSDLELKMGRNSGSLPWGSQSLLYIPHDKIRLQNHSLEDTGEQEFQRIACFWRRSKSTYDCLFQPCYNTELVANFRLDLLEVKNSLP